ncbi:helix-turn-helix domain-containing protein [Nocardia seriolae]|uniref:HTH cro/C1-type domain-containing protein n=2 Tax=Nocardia seriolae TaxID=37332 RepID=A0ABC9Z7E4_9NOCA|nr:helix-turn-helix transcriptional regulator [Nocardia seriolae]BEK96530.1 helix-turn-helix transcriptional regulator [Nocardia seriolae]GAM51051.1 hypothetical protein NS07_v2contig00198-0001 [Nocardia seriolae]GAP33008.1 hypothetical protein NSK11_contig00199-0010 [Nocardia seriolae]
MLRNKTRFPTQRGASDMTDEDETAAKGSTLPRRQLGRFLRAAREGSGLTVDQAAGLMEWHKSTLSRLERGLVERVRTRDVLGLCDIYGLDADRAAIAKALAEQAPAQSWWHAYADLIPSKSNMLVGLEAGARLISIFQPLVVPGIIQTPAYARILDRRYFPDETETEIDRRLELRAQRQQVIRRQRHPAEAVIILHEAALRTVIGDRHVMVAQLRHIADLSTHDNIDVRVLPFRAGLPLGTPLTPFMIYQSGRDVHGRLTEPTVVVAENLVGAMYFERKTEVVAYREAFATVRCATLEAGPSRDLIRELARECGNDR